MNLSIAGFAGRLVCTAFLVGVAACSADRIPSGLTPLRGSAHSDDDPPPGSQLWCADDPDICEQQTDAQQEDDLVTQWASLSEPEENSSLTEGGTGIGVSVTDIVWQDGYWPNQLQASSSTEITSGIGIAYLEGTAWFEGYYGAQADINRRWPMRVAWNHTANARCTERQAWVEVHMNHTVKFFRAGATGWTKHRSQCQWNRSADGVGEPRSDDCYFAGNVEVSYDGGRTWYAIGEVWECFGEDDL